MTKRKKIYKPKPRSTRVVTRKPIDELEAPDPEAHQRALDAMEPYLEEFQKAADEQTLKDLGVRRKP